MANTLNITEVTMAQAADATNAVNLYENQDYIEYRVIRITDHVSDTGATGTDSDGMALFKCRGKGYPWTKEDGCINRQTYAPANGETPVPTADDLKANVVFPNWDYTAF